MLTGVLSGGAISMVVRHLIANSSGQVAGCVVGAGSYPPAFASVQTASGAQCAGRTAEQCAGEPPKKGDLVSREKARPGGVHPRQERRGAAQWYFRHPRARHHGMGCASANDAPETYWSVFGERSDLPRRQMTMPTGECATPRCIFSTSCAPPTVRRRPIEESGGARFGWAYDLEGNKF